MPSFPQLFVALLAIGGLVTASRSPAAAGAAASAPAEPVVITVDANDFALRLPARVSEGIVTFRLVNHGREPHHAQIVRLEAGKSVGDFVRGFTDTIAMPAWVRYLGGPVGTAPGQELRSTARLTPGHYAVLCRIRSPDGRTHVMKGMIRAFEVVARNRAAADSFPTASDTVTLNDYGFIVRRPLSSGRHTIRVENAGPQVHHLVLLKLARGKTPADFARWGLGGRHGPPPAAPIGGVEFLDPGAAGTFAVDLGPGEYGYICFVPDAADRRRHYLHGMMTQFAVR
ncbi:MAG: hypothetical protein M3Q93_04915 [Gemmatimonadota bacterium]|nr:hypothetical protein [Gemmatimonadota bacterium]